MDDKTRFIKDPDAELDYGFDWDDWLASGETINTNTSSWTVPSGLTNMLEQISGSVTKIWLSGGTVDEEYEVTFHIVTSAGREDDRSFIIEVQQR